MSPHSVSVLRVQNEDFPDAATKHLSDARVLHVARRHDGACYLLGYVLECCLKAVRLHDHAWQATSRSHDPNLLISARNQMSSKKFGHRLEALLTTTIGPIGARYLPSLPTTASIVYGSTLSSVLKWSEVQRYQPPDPNARTVAASWIEWAEFTYDHTIVQMQLDGVI
jgi:hypothetical protein